MTTCSKGPDFLLSADLDDPDVAAHLAQCGSCARHAEQIRAAYGALDGVLARPATSPVDVETIVRRSRMRASSSGRRWRNPTGIALLAAAALAGVLLTRSPEPPLPESPARAAALAPPDVEAPGRDFAVFPTQNPDITVVWLYAQDGA